MCSTRPPVVRHESGFCRLGALVFVVLAAAAAPFVSGCSSPDVHGEDECALPNLDNDDIASTAQTLSVTRADAERVARSTPKNSRGLPLWESRPGAPVALYLDFDGGVYGSSSGDLRLGPASLDSDGSRFNTEEQIEIIRAAMEVAETYAPFNVNVTTSDAARRRSDRWAWILISNDEGSSGRGKIGAIERRTKATAYAGADAVFDPPSSQRGYLLTHELGHNFGLNHNGLYRNGEFVEWSDLEQSRTGAWMGGRNTYFGRYDWMNLQTSRSTRYQDSFAIIAAEAGLVGNPPDPGRCDGRCSTSCRCDVGEGDCDVDGDCQSGLFCEQQSGTDYCAEPVSSCDGRCTPSCRCDVGEGDCDVDGDCQSGLFCEQQSGTDYCAEPVSSCDGRCSPSCRCDVGEGDCDVDGDCQSGLFCEQQSGTDYCAEPTQDCSGQCSPDCRCAVAQGDCDRDADCRSGLFCAQQSGTDYCASDSSCNGRCSSSCPCGVGQGDCDSNADCRAGTRCVQRQGIDYCE